MECPSCNRRLVGELREDHTYDFRCASCGWGKQTLESTEIVEDIQQIKWRVWPYWGLTLIFAMAGYWLLNGYAVAAFDFAFPDSTAREFFGEATPLLIYGTITLPTYLAMSWMFQPTFEVDDGKWFGWPLNNPFTWDDDYNFMKMVLAIFLWPGKFMIFTVQFTRAVLRGK